MGVGSEAGQSWRKTIIGHGLTRMNTDKTNSFLWFVDGKDAVGGDVSEELDGAGGPVDFDGLGGGVGAEAEVDGAEAGGGVAGAGGHVIVLGAGFGGELD